MRIKKVIFVLGIFYVFDLLVENKCKMLVLIILWIVVNEFYIIVYEVDVYWGLRKRIICLFLRMVSFLIDYEGNVRVFVLIDDYINLKIYICFKLGGEWEEFNLKDVLYSDVGLYVFDSIDGFVYVMVFVNGEVKGFYRLNFKIK